MKNFFAAALASLLFVSAALAADNAIILTPGSGVTEASKDIGSGVQSPKVNLIDGSGNPCYGPAGTPGVCAVGIQGLSGGTAVPASQSGTWTMQPGNTANTTPWLASINQGGNSATVTGANALKVDNSAVTQPISGATSNASDTVATGSTNLPSVAYNFGFNGSTFDRLRSISGAMADGETPPTAGIGQIEAYLKTWNGSTWDRAQGLVTGTLGSPSSQYISVQNADPCSYAVKSSASISISSSTTTSLVAVSGSTAVYVCGFSLTIAPSGTTADSIQFEYGTGASCTGTHALTGTFGGGDLTTAASVVPVSYGGGTMTVFAAPASNGICAVTAGGTVNIQGVLTYVQQ